jgi:cell division protein FtsA
VVAIGGEHVRIMQSQGSILLRRSGFGNSGRYINRQDIKKSIADAAAVPISASLQVMHVLPINYYVDGQKVSNPEGLSGARLEVDVLIIAARQSVLNSMIKAAEYADCLIGKFCYRPMATGRAVMTGPAMARGGCLVDVGGRHTDVAVFKEGRMVFSSTLALGGEDITSDTASHFTVTRSEAEKIKLNYGHCISALPEEVEFQVTGVAGGTLWRTVKKSELGFKVIQPRVEEIIEESLLALSGSGEQESLPGGAVLTGGATQLPGFAGLAASMFPFQVNIGVNSGFENMDEISGRPDQATALGLVLLDMDQRRERRDDVMDNPVSRLCNKVLRKIHSVM